MKEYPAGLTVVHQVMALQICQLRERFVADWANGKKFFTSLAGLTDERGNVLNLTTRRGVRQSVPWCASTRCSGSENAFHTIRTCTCFRSSASPGGQPSPRWYQSAARGRRNESENYVSRLGGWGGEGVSFSHEVEGWTWKKNFSTCIKVNRKKTTKN